MYNKQRPKIGDIVHKSNTEIMVAGKPLRCGTIIAVDPRGPVKVRWSNGDEGETSKEFLDCYKTYLEKISKLLQEATDLCSKVSSSTSTT